MNLEQGLIKLGNEFSRSDMTGEDLASSVISLVKGTLDLGVKFQDEDQKANFYIELFTRDVIKPVIHQTSAVKEQGEVIEEEEEMFNLHDFVQYALGRCGGRVEQVDDVWYFKVQKKFYTTAKFYDDFMKSRNK